MTTGADTLREEIRKRYAETARRVGEGSGCGCGTACCTDEVREDGCCGDECCRGGTPGEFGQSLYSADVRDELPETAALASLGCGTPTGVAELCEGEIVLDLGWGGGIDVILSAKRVGPTGLAYGLDKTDEMLALAQRNAQTARVRNAVFLKGEIENVPLPLRASMS
jgi:arsenite methyltransferase